MTAPSLHPPHFRTLGETLVTPFLLRVRPQLRVMAALRGQIGMLSDQQVASQNVLAAQAARSRFPISAELSQLLGEIAVADEFPYRRNTPEPRRRSDLR